MALIEDLRRVPWRVLVWTLFAVATGCGESGMVENGEGAALHDARARVMTNAAFASDASAMDPSQATEEAADEGGTGGFDALTDETVDALEPPFPGPLDGAGGPSGADASDEATLEGFDADPTDGGLAANPSDGGLAEVPSDGGPAAPADIVDGQADGGAERDADAVLDSATDTTLAASADSPAALDDGGVADNLVEEEADAPLAADLEGAAEIGAPADHEAGTAVASPCPAPPEACRILPLGDSLTDGFAVPGGYRVPLFHRLLGAAQHATFVGSQQNGPAQVDGVPFPPHHEGHVGYAIDPFGGRSGISPLTPDALQTYQPHIVMLLIGTNDLDLQFDVANAPQRLGSLLDIIFQTEPNATVLLAQVPPTFDDALNLRIVAYNAAIPGLVEARASAGKHVQLVDLYGAMSRVAGYQTGLLSDRLHPNADGYAVIAEAWYAALGPLLR